MRTGDPGVAFFISVRRWKCVGRGLPGSGHVTDPAAPSKNPALAGFYAYPRSRMVLMMSVVEQPSSKFSTRTSPPLAVTSA